MAKTNDQLLAKVENRAPAQSVESTIKGLFERLKPEVAKALPKHLTAERLTRIAFTQVRRNPKLLECTPESLCSAILDCAALGLEPGPLNTIHLIPYNNKKKFGDGSERWVREVQTQIGYQGFIELALRTGNYKTIAAHPICENDVFEYEEGFDPKLKHVPNIRNRGSVVGVYAYAIMKDGGVYAEVLSIDDIEKIRSKSKGKDGGPWVEWFEEMARKSALKRLLKYAPKSIELASLIQEDDDREIGGVVSASLNLQEVPVSLVGTAEIEESRETEKPRDIPPNDVGGVRPAVVNTIQQAFEGAKVEK